MEERDLSVKAREAWLRREEQSHETVLAMLRKLEGTGVGRQSGGGGGRSVVPLKKENCEDGVVRRRTLGKGGMDIGGVELRRNRRMGKFVEQLPSEEEVEEMEKEVILTEEEGNTKADWRLSRMGPKVLSYEPAPWEEEEMEKEEMEKETVSRMGPKVRSYEPAPWEEEDEQEEEEETSGNQFIPSAFQERNSQGLEDIVEDEEDSESLRTQYTDGKPKMLTPPAEYSLPSTSSGGYFPIYKLPSDIFPAPPSPRSPRNAPTSPTSPISDLSIPKSPLTPAKSPSNLRSRAGLKKIFLSTLRPRKRDDIEPLSPTLTISSSAATTPTTPSLPTPTIRITSPFHPRRFDGSPLDDHPMVGKLSPIETGYRLPELRLSRADWGEWGRQVADRI